jgi:hypothetical protein
MQRPSHRALRALVSTVLVFAAVGCGDDSDSGADGESGDSAASASGGNGPVAQNCAERCADKAASCGAPDDVASAQCGGICDGTLTEDQLACLEDEDCATLTEVFLGSGDACGLGGGSSATGASATGASATGSTPDADIGDACECSDPEADFESCSGTGSPCGDLTCYVVFGDGICSQPCTADDCPTGECTEQLVNGVVVGTWCVP